MSPGPLILASAGGVENILGRLLNCSARLPGAAFPHSLSRVVSLLLLRGGQAGAYALGRGCFWRMWRMVSWSVPGVGVPVGFVWSGRGVPRKNQWGQCKMDLPQVFFVP